MQKYSFLLLVVALFLLACQGESEQQRDERLGASQLASARTSLKDGRYDDARDSILALRHDHPLAMQTRRQAILLLDSIELQAAQDSLSKLNTLDASTAQMQNNQDSTLLRQHPDMMSEQERLSVKVKFFKRKLEVDKRKAEQQ